MSISGAQISARTALALMQIGLLTYRDWVKPWQHESELIERALTKWLRKATSELQMFQFGIAYSDRRAESVSNYLGYLNGVPNNFDNIAFTLYRIGSRPVYKLADGITGLETTVNGLGETAMYYFNQAWMHTVPMLTPYFALGCAQNAHWMGEEDESEYLADAMGMGETDNPDEIECYRISDFLAEIPEWVAKPRPRLTHSSLRRIALDMPGTDAGTVAGLLLKMSRGLKGVWGPNTLDENLECTEIAGEFIWSEADDCARLFDDAMTQAFNSGESTDDFGSAFLPPEPRRIKEWMRSAEKTFRLLRLCEQLVRIVGTPVH